MSKDITKDILLKAGFMDASDNAFKLFVEGGYIILQYVQQPFGRCWKCSVDNNNDMSTTDIQTIDHFNKLMELMNIDFKLKEELTMKKYKFLFCDLDGTLIKTISGKTFAEDVTDFRIRKEVLDKIKELNEVDKLAFIAIVTNQGGIPQYVSENDFYAKLTAIKTFVCQYTKVPMVVADYCISLDADNEYRKPNTGMLSRVVRSYEKTFAGKFTPDNALMIGDASGKPGQWSDTDKKTAENFGIDYMDVEDFANVKFEELTMRVTEFETVFTNGITEHLEQGKLYVNEKLKIARHLCPCGCGGLVQTPINDGSDYSWQYTNHNGKITLRPSIGNFSLPCKSHYYITENRVEWVLLT